MDNEKWLTAECRQQMVELLVLVVNCPCWVWSAAAVACCLAWVLCQPVSLGNPRAHPAARHISMQQHFISIVNIAVFVSLASCIRYTFWVFAQVGLSAIFFVCSIDSGTGDTFSLIFWQYLIPILLSWGALVKSCQQQHYCDWQCKTRTVVLHLK